MPSVAKAKQRYAHGTHARYVFGKCRCEPCKEARRAYDEQRSIAKRPFRAKQDDQGEWRSYDARTQRFGRRFGSRGAALKYTASLNRKHSQAHPRPSDLIDATNAREHLAWLQTQGVGLRIAARAARLSYGTVDHIRSGQLVRTRRATAESILTIDASARSDRARTRVDETLILVNRLVGAGYRRGWIAKQLGSRWPSLGIGKTEWIEVRTARAVHSLYNRLHATNATLPPIAATFSPTLVEASFRRGGRQPSSPTTRTPVPEREDFAHGTRACYTEGGCRCDKCVEAEHDYREARRIENRLPYQLTKSSEGWIVRARTGGTVVFQSNERDAAMGVRDHLNDGDPAAARKRRIDSTRVREHLMELASVGIGQTAIAQASGVTACTIWRLVNGLGKTVSRDVADKLLSVDDKAVPAMALVDATESYELVDRLIAAGFADTWLAYLLGSHLKTLRTRGRSIRVCRARAIYSLYANLRERVGLIRALEDQLAA
jgi:hypothetical protein